MSDNPDFMNGLADDPRLMSVVDELRALKQELSDLEWDSADEIADGKRSEQLRLLDEKIAHFENLQRDGIDVEPRF
jgi:hypothetical protein